MDKRMMFWKEKGDKSWKLISGERIVAKIYADDEDEFRALALPPINASCVYLGVYTNLETAKKAAEGYWNPV
jgi:hypothetical protein